jgi:hypothetical protein
MRKQVSFNFSLKQARATSLSDGNATEKTVFIRKFHLRVRLKLGTEHLSEEKE